MYPMYLFYFFTFCILSKIFTAIIPHSFYYYTPIRHFWRMG